MSESKSMLKNELKKHSRGSKTSASCSLDSPPPPPPTISNSNVNDPSCLNNTRPSPVASPADTGNKGDAQETKGKSIYVGKVIEEMFPSPCDYGEPMRPQHLVLDFSPIEGVDDDAYNVKKVLDFWKFIRSVPGLDNLRASPEDCDENENDEDIPHEESEHDGSEKTPIAATSAIPWMKHDYMMCTALAARQRGKYCEQGAGDYIAPQPHKTTKKCASKPGTSHSSCGSKQESEGPRYPGSSQAIAPQADVHTLCRQLDEWDHLHPSPQEPPATPPKRGYITAVLQRKT